MLDLRRGTLCVLEQSSPETKFRAPRIEDPGKALLYFNKIMDELADKTPFHCIITAPTNGGKTRFLIDKLRGSFRYVF